MKLYELAENYNNLYDLIENEEVPIEVIEEALKEIEDNIETKFDNTAKLVKTFEGQIKVFKDEEKRLNARRTTIENKIKRLKEYMLDQLTIMDRTKIQANTFTINKQRNPQSIEIVDEEKLSEEYLIPQKPKPNSKAIKEALDSGKDVDGATWKPESYHVRIR